jgi:3-oxoacyl-[acyl-carrier-protein] synthase-3
MIGKEVFENGVARMSESVFESLEANGVTMDDIDLLIPHQANLRMLEAVIKRTGFPADRTFLNVVDHGNIASATLPIALDQARKSGTVGPGSLCLLVAFGIGLRLGFGAAAVGVSASRNVDNFSRGHRLHAARTA